MLTAADPRCVRCGERFSRDAYPFGQLLARGPLCAVCLEDIFEHARSWGGDYAQFETRVQARLERERHNSQIGGAP
jgi:hypothetical protein